MQLILRRVILTYIKDRYRVFYVYTVMTPAPTYVEHVKNNGMIPEYDGYIPYVGEDVHGEFREPTDAEYKAAFERVGRGGKFGNRDLEMYLKGIPGIKILSKLMKILLPFSSIKWRYLGTT